MPAAVVVGVLLVVPIGWAVLLAFLKVDLSRVQPWTFNGLNNFVQISRDDFVLEVAVRTVYFAAVVVTFVTIAGMGMALLLNEPFPGRRIVRLLVFLPWAIAPIAAGATWQLVFHVTTGLLNGVLLSLGVISRNVGWLNDGTFALHAAILGQAWLAIPFVSLVFLARLQSIPSSLYRAAEMDGAGMLAKFRYITLPQLTPTILVVVLLETIVTLQTFDLIYSLTKGGPALSTVVFNMLIYTRSFIDLRLGYGSALAIMLFLVVVVANLVIVLAFRSGRPAWAR